MQTAPAAVSPLRVGVVDHSAPDWSAGGTFTEVTLRSLQAVAHDERLELTLLSSRPTPSLPGVGTLELSTKTPRRGEARLRAALGLLDRASPFSMAARHHLDVLLPPLDVPPWTPPVRTVAWIPDLQHRHLAENFSSHELARREAICERLFRHADLVLVSSGAVRADIERQWPAGAAKVRMASFPSVLAFEELESPRQWARSQYGLPERYALVANQFWRHKNHNVVVDSLALLQARGILLDAVMTGVPVDHRDPGNRVLSQLLQQIAARGLHSQVRLLGEVPPAALYDLLRTATVIIQPSRFEGWGTIVEDVLTLGRPLICSDLPVHREHAPDSLGFFAPDRPEALAEILARTWPTLPPGPDLEAERRGRQLGRERARQYGMQLAALCREAATRRR